MITTIAAIPATRPRKKTLAGELKALKNTKGHSGILHIRYVEYAVYYRSRLA